MAVWQTTVVRPLCTGTNSPMMFVPAVQVVADGAQILADRQLPHDHFARNVGKLDAEKIE